MIAKIVDWTASSGPMQLTIKVGIEPLGITEHYIWKYGGRSYSRWDWYYANGEQEVIGNESKDLLTELVNQHGTLSLLIDYFKMPRIEYVQ